MRFLFGSLVCLMLASASASAQTRKRTDLYGDPLPDGAVARLGTLSLRPGGSIWHLAFSPDSKKLACWCSNVVGMANTFATYDVATGKELRWTPVPDYRARALVWPADGRGRIILQAEPGEEPTESKIFMWEFTDLQSDLPKRRISVDNRQFVDQRCFALSPDGQWVASSGRGFGPGERFLQVRPWQGGKHLKDVPPINSISLGKRRCLKLLYFADGKTLLAICTHKEQGKAEVLLLDAKTGKLGRSFTVPWNTEAEPEENLVAIGDGVAAIGSRDYTVRMVALKTGRVESELPFPKKKEGRLRTLTLGLAFAPSGKLLAASEFEGPFRLWNLAENKLIWEKDNHSRYEAIAFSIDGKLVAGGTRLGAIKIWDTATGNEIAPQKSFHNWPADLAMWGKDDKLIVTDSEPRLTSWSISNGKLLNEVTLSGWLWGVTPAPDGKKAVYILDRRAHSWDLEHKVEPLWRPEGPRADELAFSKDGKTLVSFYQDQVSFWNWPEGKLLRTWSLSLDKPEKREYKSFFGLKLSRDSHELLISSMRVGTSGIKLESWDSRTGKLQRDIQHTGEFARAHFSPDESAYLLAGNARSKNPEAGALDLALVWADRSTGKHLRYFRAPFNPHFPTDRRVHAVAFSPDGRLLASAENHHSVPVFETASGLVRRVLTGHRHDVGQVAFTSDGRRLITVSTDLTGLVWDMSLPTQGKAGATKAQVNEAWDNLKNDKDGSQIEPALATLAANPREFLELVSKNITPAKPLDVKVVEQWIADLDRPEFAVRSKALEKLDRLGEDIVPILRKHSQKKDLSLETSRRLQSLITKLDPVNPSPQRLRDLRAVELLEYLGTTEAREQLRRLADGAPQARLTLDAAAALGRLEKQ